MPNTRGLGFWLKQLKSDTEASQSNLSTVANIDTDESLDGADSTSMTTLLTHTVAHSTKPSFRPKTNNQPLKKFLSLALS